MEELGGRVVLADALAEPGGEGGGERRRAVGGHGDDRAEHRRRAAGRGPAPRVDHRLDRRQLPGVDELDVGAEDGVLGQRHRVVGVGAVDERRRHQHDVRRADRRSASASITAAPSVTFSRRRARRSWSPAPRWMTTSADVADPSTTSGSSASSCSTRRARLPSAPVMWIRVGGTRRQRRRTARHTNRP